MRPLRAAVLAAFLCASFALTAQQGPPPPVPADQQTFGLDALVEGPAAQSSFTFDRSMLSLADSWFAGNSPDVHRVVAGINSISVHNFHFRDEAEYNLSAWPMIEDNFRAGNWKHLVNANANSGAQTDLWIRFEGATIRNVVVLTRARRDMNYIVLDCTLRPLDLLHLSGHFGIPKVDENAVMVPAPPPPQDVPVPHTELKRR